MSADSDVSEFCLWPLDHGKKTHGGGDCYTFVVTNLNAKRYNEVLQPVIFPNPHGYYASPSEKNSSGTPSKMWERSWMSPAVEGHDNA